MNRLGSWDSQDQNNARNILYFPHLKGGSYEKIVCLWACVRVKRTSLARTLSVRNNNGPSGNSIRRTRVWGPFASKPIGRLRTDGNRVREKHDFPRYLSIRNMNPGPKHLRDYIDQLERNGNRVDGIMRWYPRSIIWEKSYVRISSRNRCDRGVGSRIDRTSPE